MLAPTSTTAKPCKRGHIGAGRYRNGACIECQRLTSIAYYWKDPERSRRISREYFGKNPKQIMLNSARERAKIGGYACTIATKDIVIPEFCPLLGIRLEHNWGKKKLHAASPSLDKIVPALGYVPGNVWVISQRANHIKSNATLQELQTIVANLAKVVCLFPWECE